MRVTPTGDSEYFKGNEILRYGIDNDTKYAIWYHDSVPGFDTPTWAMDRGAEYVIDYDVDTLLVADAEHGLYAIPRDTLTSRLLTLAGRTQYAASADDEGVTHLGDPNEHLRGRLWIESGNEVDENYHQEQGHA